MPKQTWQANVTDEAHTITARWSHWTGSGEITVDDRVVDAWGLTVNLSQRKFTVAGLEAILRWPGVFASKSELFVDGELID